MEPDRLLLCLQDFTTGPHPEPVESCPHLHASLEVPPPPNIILSSMPRYPKFSD